MKELLITFGILLGAAALWFLKSTNDSIVVDMPSGRPTQEVLSATPPRTLVQAPSLPAPATPATVEVVNTSTAALQDRLIAEQKELENQKQILSDLQAQQAAQQQAPTQYSSQMSRHQDEIENLSEVLENSRYQEGQLNEMFKQSARSLGTNAQIAIAQIEDAIRAQEQVVQQVQAAMSNLKNNSYAVNSQAQMAELQQSYNDQLLQLQALQAQKANLGLNVVQQNDADQAVVTQAREELLSTQANAQDQIYNLRDEIHRLQTAQGESRMSVMSLSAQINQTQKSIQQKNQEVNELQSQIQATRQE